MRKIDEKILYRGKWISLKEITYRGKKNDELKWESVERTNTVNTVVMLSKLIPSNRYILIKQYRAAIDNYVIGFPAGLMENDDAAENALRELKEETGYIGKVGSESPLLYSNAALLSDTVRLLGITVDENLPENKNPKQELEDSEDIEVILIEKHKIIDFLKKEQKSGTALGIGCWYVFCGLQNN
ncbi:NUDIX hydrolase [Clostridium tyrobutyricum]|jgi:ADP-ribose pyrophosphatase|uniref:NUDIX domain-containing protein n=1 Tax=Clostridium tyrobutyricum TaxID=1519 RepID=UPI0003017BE2|nr:NUDIX hydrolase [Clostridium tyrobutyricum]MBR9648817.1 NUDIX hydrolase [Clostridium tyrobutyricum]MBV4418221.1 NUDIX hydrolase [Clostridium tyrobutyricum]MBV4425350.1 NUDIX hydrolase [Clostridium tyrobutyricum]MBV4427766.1 NUDIX hydrolase [Clostridium tyrobutyricum]MBV4431624.1 NUDIX hydrolase [Clostridium tyrobutyricum]